MGMRQSELYSHDCRTAQQTTAANAPACATCEIAGETGLRLSVARATAVGPWSQPSHRIPCDFWHLRLLRSLQVCMVVCAAMVPCGNDADRLGDDELVCLEPTVVDVGEALSCQLRERLVPVGCCAWNRRKWADKTCETASNCQLADALYRNVSGSDLFTRVSAFTGLHVRSHTSWSTHAQLATVAGLFVWHVLLQLGRNRGRTYTPYRTLLSLAHCSGVCRSLHGLVDAK